MQKYVHNKLPIRSILQTQKLLTLFCRIRIERPVISPRGDRTVHSGSHMLASRKGIRTHLMPTFQSISMWGYTYYVGIHYF